MVSFEYLPGIGPTLNEELIKKGFKSEKDLKAHLDLLPDLTKSYLKYPWKENISHKPAVEIANELKRRLRFGGKKYPIEKVGSIIRYPTVKTHRDIDLLVVADSWKGDVTLAGKGKLKIVDRALIGKQRQGIVAQYGRNYIFVDLFRTTLRDKPYALFQYRSPKIYVIRKRKYVKDKYGLSLNQYGLFKNGERLNLPQIKTERDLIEYLNFRYKTPANRYS
jgi:DNA polymerase/3'-5' exonuclease PolX